MVLGTMCAYQFGTVTLKVIRTILARVACPNEAPHTYFISNFEVVHLASDFCHNSYNLVPSEAGWNDIYTYCNAITFEHSVFS